MRICITLDEVIRAKAKQIGKMYKKYIDSEFDPSMVDFTNKKLYKEFNFETKDDFNEFLYDDYAFQIFGEAEVVKKGIDKRLLTWHLDLHEEYDGDVELVLANANEHNQSIGFTHFFLAKIATRIRETHFPFNTQDILEYGDVIITATPELISKGSDKVIVKINADYNKDLEGDLEYETLADLMDDAEFISKIKDKINEKEND